MERRRRHEQDDGPPPPPVRLVSSSRGGPAELPDAVVAGPEPRPRLLPRGALPVLLGALAVAGLGISAVPDLREQAAAAAAPPVVEAVPSGGTLIGGRLRVWLLLEGPPSARVSGVSASLPGSAVRTGSEPEQFSPRGYAALRLDVDPGCPAAVAGLDRAALTMRVDDGRERGPATVRVPFDTSGILAGTVRARCSGLALGDDDGPDGPLVRAGGTGPGGTLRTVVELGAPGPEVLVLERVTAGAGLAVDVLTPLPLRVVPGTRREVVVDLRATGCVTDATPGETPAPYLLEYAATGEVEPRVDPGLRGRLGALRRTGC